MLLNFYHIAWHHIPEDSTVRSASMSWNFKSHVQWHISERILTLVHYYEPIKHMLLQRTVVFWVYCIITYRLTCENSGFWCHIYDIFTLLECYTAYAGICLQMFWDSLSAPSLRIKHPNKNAGQKMDPLILGVVCAVIGSWGGEEPIRLLQCEVVTRIWWERKN